MPENVRLIPKKDMASQHLFESAATLERDHSRLYFTIRSTLYAVSLKVAGIPVPVGRKGA